MSQVLKSVKTPAWVDEFKAFIMRGNVVDLAVGVVIGAAFTGIVGSLVKDMITPVIGLISGGVDFSNLFVTLKGPVEPTLADAVKAGSVTLNYGWFPKFINRRRRPMHRRRRPNPCWVKSAIC
jgi:large conductance mechanosensitive channel